jgi:four helix bundle protein
MGIDDLQVYQLAMVLGERVWAVVVKWDGFSKSTVGNQAVRSADSVAANISEGFGRYHYKENIHFCYIARGSLLETRTWLDKAQRRQLISTEVYAIFHSEIDTLGRKLNAYLRSLGKQSGSSGYQVSEPAFDYNTEPNELDLPWETAPHLP